MKPLYKIKRLLKPILCMLSLMAVGGCLFAQDSIVIEEKTVPVKKFVKNTFESAWIIDNQTVEVPVKGTFEMDIMHRFGTLNKGYKDFYGFFAPSNIRLGFSYTPIDNLMAGVSITKSNMTWEGYAKYAILKQTKGRGYPVSITYYGNVAVETRLKENYLHFSDRISYFHQLLIARKLTDRISIQVAPSLTHVNFVYGEFVDSTVNKEGKIQLRNHEHFAVAVSGRFKIKEGMGIIVNYDQPLTKHKTDNPHPNLSLGLELTTSSHAFQIFLGNYYFMIPQKNNYFNRNNYRDKQFLIGFNITRLWNY